MAERGEGPVARRSPDRAVRGRGDPADAGSATGAGIGGTAAMNSTASGHATPEHEMLREEFRTIHPGMPWCGIEDLHRVLTRSCYEAVGPAPGLSQWTELVEADRECLRRQFDEASLLPGDDPPRRYDTFWRGFAAPGWDDLGGPRQAAFVSRLLATGALRAGFPDALHDAVYEGLPVKRWAKRDPDARAAFERSFAKAIALPEEEQERRYTLLRGEEPSEGDWPPAWKALSPEQRTLFGNRLSDAARAWERVQLQRCHTSVHNLPDPGRTALCLSGGGIRSAAFALGVLQGLAGLGLLGRFHYLSTVSGGGYIGAWLTAWASRRGARNFATVEAKLAAAVAPEPLRELRGRQAFLTPKTGPGSPDTWQAIAHVVRNLLLNWLVFVPLLAAVLLLPVILTDLLRAIPAPGKEAPAVSLLLYVVQVSVECIRDHVPDLRRFLNLGTPDPALSLLDGLDLAALLFVAVGLVVSMTNRTTAGPRAINDQRFVFWVLVPVILGALSLVFAERRFMAGGWSVTSAMMWQWPLLCALAFAVIRLLAWSAVRLRAKTEADAEHGSAVRTMLEVLLAQPLAGALVGIIVVGGLVLREWVGVQKPGQDDGGVLRTEYLQDLAAFGVPWLLMALLAGQILLSGLTSRLLPYSGDRNREWLARASGYYGAFAIGWAAFAWVALYGWSALEGVRHWLLPTLTVGTGLASLLGGAGPLTAAMGLAARAGRHRSNLVVAACSVVFLFCLCAWIAEGTRELLAWLRHWSGEHFGPAMADRPGPWSDLAWSAGGALGLAIFAVVASYFVNVNYFSLNALYRNRLVRAFLGASNVRAVTGVEPKRNPFDGFAEKDTPDNPPMRKTWKPPPRSGRPAVWQPFPVINMTLNLAATKNTAWQERKAAAFTATPLRIGSSLLGYRSAKRYAAGRSGASGLTLGTAMSVSGAAVSPNWGYHSSPLTSFLLAMFNLRLGIWLGNPGRDTFRWDGPRIGAWLLVQEAMGWTSSDRGYVYLSDGGHFENLGLYEMVRRRCRTIVVSDAGQDAACALEDLGNALRKIAIDLGVRVDFKPINMGPRGTDPTNPGVYCAVGTITYPEPGAPEGRIVYIKAGLYGTLPADVRAYAAANAKFPHDTTLNQWFSESQFESYRALGRHAVEEITRTKEGRGSPLGKPSDVAELVDRAEHYVKSAKEGGAVRVRVVA